MKWIIDTDPGIDDAAAIVAAVRSGMDVIGLTTVAGNSPLTSTTRNALRLVELLDVPVPVFEGAEQPLLEPSRYAPEVHGEDGFGDCGLPEPRRQAERLPAADFISQSAAQYGDGLAILAVGPLTNLALAIAKERKATRRIQRIVLMGGTSDGRGNTTMTGEFNVRFDPEAAAIVFNSGIPITMVPWETCLKALLRPAQLEPLERSDRPLAQVFTKMTRTLVDRVEAALGFRGLVLCDLLATAAIVDPDVVTEQVEAYVAVETAGSIGRGMTAVDYMWLSGREPNARVCLNVDVERIAGLLVRSFTV